MLSGKRVIALVVIVLMVMEVVAYGFVTQPPFASNPAFGPGGTGRHVDFDLSSPTGEPVTLLGPAWDTDGVGGDWTCDDVIMLGAVGWLPAGPGWAGHTGLIGIDNSTGVTDLSGSLTFHVNNFPEPNWHKLVWDEVVYYEGVGANINHVLATGPGPNIPAPWVVSQEILNVAPVGGTGPGFIEQ